MKNLIKAALNRLGLELRKSKYIPEHTFVGLCRLPIKTILDVGANTGQFARKAYRLFPDAKIICFEPLPNPYEELLLWAKQNTARVSAVNLAVGDADQTTNIYCHVKHDTSSSLLASTERNKQLYPFTKEQVCVPVQVKTLDHAVAAEHIPLTPDILIKVDVQGYEDRVLRGGAKTFAQATACILEVSVEHLYEGQPRFRDLVVMLDDLGFDYVGNLDQCHAEDGHVIYFNAVFRQRHMKTLERHVHNI